MQRLLVLMSQRTTRTPTQKGGPSLSLIVREQSAIQIAIVAKKTSMRDSVMQFVKTSEKWCIIAWQNE
jgi:hypothetical protein